MKRRTRGAVLASSAQGTLPASNLGVKGGPVISVVAAQINKWVAIPIQWSHDMNHTLLYSSFGALRNKLVEAPV
jgi:hypothetical protein